MNAETIIATLTLPESTRIDQRVPKELLAEQSARTAADRRTIKEGIEALWWVAALKPNTIGVPAFHDDEREYLEIAVLHAVLCPGAKAARLIELIHRAVPYPVLLVMEREADLALSLAHKRWAQNEAGKMVLEENYPHTTPITSSDPPGFFQSLAVAPLPRTDMFALYQGWLDALTALEAARRTGEFRLTGADEHLAARRAALAQLAELEAEIARLRKAAAKEKQIPRQVALNLEIKRLEADRLDVLQRL